MDNHNTIRYCTIYLLCVNASTTKLDEIRCYLNRLQYEITEKATHATPEWQINNNNKQICIARKVVTSEALDVQIAILWLTVEYYIKFMSNQHNVTESKDL